MWSLVLAERFRGVLVFSVVVKGVCDDSRISVFKNNTSPNILWYHFDAHPLSNTVYLSGSQGQLEPIPAYFR